MTQDHRRHERHRARLVVRYRSAAEFVLEYTENLSLGGIFVAGARDLELLQEIELDVELPELGTWKVRAKPVYFVDADAAAKTGRVAGAGMEITGKLPGFDDALLGYLLRLGRRRDFACMVGDVPGAEKIADSGYRVLPLANVFSFVTALAKATVPIVAVVVLPSDASEYEALARTSGAGEIVFAISNATEAADLVARLDGML